MEERQPITTPRSIGDPGSPDRLEPEQEELLDKLVQAARSVERHERTFHFARSLGGDVVYDGGLPGGLRVLDSDLTEFEHRGLIDLSNVNMSGTFDFRITREGFAYHDHVAGSGEPLHQVEDEVVRYLEADAFKASYPEAYGEWAAAASLRGQSDKLTAIGHEAREAMKAFAAALVERYRPSDVASDPSKTVNRIKSVVTMHREALGESRAAALDALIDYWKTVVKLADRLEHGAQKEHEPIGEKDGRQVVFLTAVAMYEIDRALQDAPLPPVGVYLRASGGG